MIVPVNPSLVAWQQRQAELKSLAWKLHKLAGQTRLDYKACNAAYHEFGIKLEELENTAETFANGEDAAT